VNTLNADSDRTDADFDLHERARRVVMQATARTTYPHRAATKELIGFMVCVLRLHEAGLTTGELRMLPEAVHGLIDDLSGPVTADHLEAAARQESDADRREDSVQDLRLIAGDSTLRREQHAELLEDAASKGRVLARVLRSLVRHERAARETARQRFDLPA